MVLHAGVRIIPEIDFPADKIAPVAVITPSSTSLFNKDWIQSLVNEWSSTDDVFRPEFLQNIIILSTEQQHADMGSIHDKLQSDWGTAWSATIRPEADVEGLTSGPFIIWKGQLCKAFRLYDDSQHAFIVVTRPKILKGVAVPSRIGVSKNNESPLAGARFAVKDLFDIEGLKLTVGCCAWYDLSSPAKKTAPVLQKLLDGGANLVGTLKLGSLITREEPAESADYIAPFNPRGDGYQSAWSSSGGSGASLASYNWLDFTLGTDTTGSSRRPALANGLFQLRVTKSTLPFEGVIPSWFPFDAPAMYARDINKLEKWIGAWISAEYESFLSNPVILWPTDFWPIDNKNTLGVKRTDISIQDLWREKTPKEANTTDIKEYLKNVGVTSFCYGVYEELEIFRRSYREKYSEEPYINPVMRWRWEAAKDITRDQHEGAVYRLSIYKNFALNEVLQSQKRDAIMILPITSQQVNYRDVPADPPSAPNAFDGIWLAPVLSAPELSVPSKYQSR
ncbi:amidase signature domain-containing protein [Phaeosphaeriaceae sp. PMI808]|nr:amidase signature domain-containing protein [Phaeosphaeriaceae sp. PMI808]